MERADMDKYKEAMGRKGNFVILHTGAEVRKRTGFKFIGLAKDHERILFIEGHFVVTTERVVDLKDK